MSAYTAAPNGQHAAAPSQNGHAPAPPAETGSNSLTALVRALETVQFGNPSDVQAFCDALRGLHHRISVETSLAAHELAQMVAAEAKAKGPGIGIPNFDIKRAGRRVTRELERSAAHAADASASAVKAWGTFLKEFEPLLEGRKPREVKKGFEWNG